MVGVLKVKSVDFFFCGNGVNLSKAMTDILKCLRRVDMAEGVDGIDQGEVHCGAECTAGGNPTEGTAAVIRATAGEDLNR